MTELFTKILNMSLSASALVFIVLFLRLILCKAPKWINVLLWGMVALRLVCPFSIESDFSQVPKSVSTGQALSQWTDDYVGGVTIIHDSSTQYEAAIEAGRTPIPAGEEGTYVVTAPDQVSAPKTIGNTVIPVLSVFWLLGIIAMLQYTFLSYDRLRSRVQGAVLFQDNISLSEAVSTPFVLGIFRPWIYLPVDIPEPDICHVIAHERMHIQRKDHWWKPLGFLLLCIHWFNPLIWLAYTLFCRDIELACDERAVKNMNPGQRANYSQALLNCSVRQRPISACPLTFGEVGVKDRVKNVLSYKKPAVWLIGIALLLCLTVALCFLTDPKTSAQLKWLQDLTTANVDYIEYRCFDAPLDSQYHLYQGGGLPEAVEVLKSFDGEPCDPIDPQSLLGGSYTLNIVQKNGQIHTVTNYGNKYLSIDNSFFEDTCGILNQIWDYYFAGTAYLPSAENTGLGVSLTIEAVSPTGATLVFDQYDTTKDDVLFGGNDYFLQVKTGNGWEDLPTLEVPTFAGSSYSISNIRRHEIDWQWLYGALSSGHYRIGKNIHIWKESNMRNFGTVYAEFTISEGTETSFAKIYTYRSSNLRTDVCSMALYGDGTFVLHPGPLSSDYSTGSYTFTDSELYMQTADGAHTYTFTAEGDSFFYDASRSSVIDMTSEASTTGTVPDGAAFTLETLLSTPDLAAPKISLEDLTATGALLVADWDELPTGTYFRGSDYYLQVYKDGNWVELETQPSASQPSDAFQQTDASVFLAQELDWAAVYGALPNGTYRLCVDFHLFYPNSGIIRTACVDFGFGHVHLGTATVADPNPYAITSALKADEVRCDALFPESGSRYTFYKDQDVELVSILNSLTPEDFLPTTGISAKTTVFISHKDYLISLYYDGEAVQLAVTDSTGTNNAWAVQNAQLNNFLDRISLNSPSNSNDEIYDLAPLTSLSPYYTVEQAAIDKVVTMVDGDIRYNAHIWKDFLSATESEQPATVRILKYYHEADGNEAVRAIYDLEYDGTQYILHGARDGTPYTRTFQHLRREHVAIYPIQRDYDEYECYYLTNSRIITLKNLDDDRFTDPAKADQYTPIIVYSDLIAYPAHPEIPTNLTYATLDWEGNTVATVSDSDTLEKLYTLLSNAEEQTSGERPYAPGLSLILYPASGEVVTLKLDTASDLVRVGSSAFYDYGPGTDARRELFSLLGLNVTGSGDFSQELYGLMGPLPGGRSLEALERESGRLRQLLEWENGA